MKDLSIIIPAYNMLDDEILRIKDFIKNNFKKYEFIFIDDASSVNKKKINQLGNLIKLSYQGIFLNNKENHGPAYSRNLGIKHSTCKYISFLDSDDYWFNNKFEIQKSILEKGYDIVGSSHLVCVDIQKKKLGLLNENKKISYRDCSFLNFLFKNQFCTPSVIGKSTVFKENLFNENLRYAEDYELWLRLSKKYKISKVCNPLVVTFKHDYLSNKQSLSSNLIKMELGELNALSKQFSYKYLHLNIIILISIIFSIFKFHLRLIKKIFYKLI